MHTLTIRLISYQTYIYLIFKKAITNSENISKPTSAIIYFRIIFSSLHEKTSRKVYSYLFSDKPY